MRYRKPHPKKKFKEYQRLYTNINDIKEYYVLIYSENLAVWILVPFEDETYSKFKQDINIGGVVAMHLYTIGYENLHIFSEEINVNYTYYKMLKESKLSTT